MNEMIGSSISQLRIVILLSVIVIVIYLIGQRDVPNPQERLVTIKTHDDRSNQQKQLKTNISSIPQNILNTSESYAKFDKSLCQYQQMERDYYVGTTPCPKHVVTVQQGGRLCNQLWEYAAVWAAAKRTGYEPYIPNCLHEAVSVMYASITAGKFEDIAHCPLNETDFVVSRYDHWDGTTNLIIPKYIVEWNLILAYAKDLKKEFVLNKDLSEESQTQLSSLDLPYGTVYVGVHIRKTDYTNYLKDVYNREPADVSFYENAMRIFENKYEQVGFVVVSDDPDWCFEYLGNRKNVHVMGKKKINSAELDLAILSSCNHSIIDYGSCGSWSAVMAGGETIYYNITSHLTAKIGHILHWQTL